MGRSRAVPALCLLVEARAPPVYHISVEAARDAKADRLVMDAEKASVMVVRGLKILKKLGLCTTTAGEDKETMFALSLKAFGDCRHGAPGGGDSTVLDPVA